MKHPAPEEWMTLLYGEATAQGKRLLTDHLDECADCHAQFAKWRGTMKSLDAGPAPVARRRFVPSPVRWAAAAAVLLGLGLVLGRFGFATGEANLRVALRAEMEHQVAAARSELTREFEQRQNAAIAQVLAAADVKIASNTERLSDEFAKTFDATRAADREVYFAALKELDEKRQEQLATLRKGLEAVVVLADYGFEATQQRLAQLAGSTQTTPLE